jgi:hypothetical protein
MLFSISASTSGPVPVPAFNFTGDTSGTTGGIPTSTASGTSHDFLLVGSTVTTGYVGMPVELMSHFAKAAAGDPNYTAWQNNPQQLTQWLAAAIIGDLAYGGQTSTGIVTGINVAGVNDGFGTYASWVGSTLTYNGTAHAADLSSALWMGDESGVLGNGQHWDDVFGSTLGVSWNQASDGINGYFLIALPTVPLYFGDQVMQISLLHAIANPSLLTSLGYTGASQAMDALLGLSGLGTVAQWAVYDENGNPTGEWNWEGLMSAVLTGFALFGPMIDSTPPPPDEPPPDEDTSNTIDPPGIMTIPDHQTINGRMRVIQPELNFIYPTLRGHASDADPRNTVYDSFLESFGKDAEWHPPVGNGPCPWCEQWAFTDGTGYTHTSRGIAFSRGLIQKNIHHWTAINLWGAERPAQKGPYGDAPTGSWAMRTRPNHSINLPRGLFEDRMEVSALRHSSTGTVGHSLSAEYMTNNLRLTVNTQGTLKSPLGAFTDTFHWVGILRNSWTQGNLRNYLAVCQWYVPGNEWGFLTQSAALASVAAYAADMQQIPFNTFNAANVVTSSYQIITSWTWVSTAGGGGYWSPNYSTRWRNDFSNAGYYYHPVMHDVQRTANVNQSSEKYVTRTRPTTQPNTMGVVSSGGETADTGVVNYRTVSMHRSTSTLRFYPEVIMRAFNTASGETIATIPIPHQEIWVMGERERNIRGSAMYVIRLDDTAPSVRGQTISDMPAVGTRANSLSSANGGLPVYYQGSNITLKTEESDFSFNLTGFAVDIVSQGDNPITSNSSINQMLGWYSPKTLWGNGGYNPQQEFTTWVDEVKDKLNVEISLDVNRNGWGSDIKDDFSVSLTQFDATGLQHNGEAHAVYHIDIANGGIVEGCQGFQQLLSAIGTAYGVNATDARTIFNNSDVGGYILRAIEHINSADNTSIDSANGGERWYDEKVRTIVVKEFRANLFALPQALVNGKIDIGWGPNQTSNRVEDLFSNGFQARWLLTAYFEEALSTIPGQPFNPRQQATRNTAVGNYLIVVNRLPVADADFVIADATTADARR